MALTTIEYGSLASSATLNNNFNYLDGRITTANNTISSLNAQISTVNTNLSTNKANKDLSNVTDTVLTGKLSSTVLTNAGCLTSANISSASSSTKSTIIGWGIPDYTAGVSLSSGSTTSKDGYIYIQAYVDNGTATITLGATTFTIGGQYDEGENKDSLILPVANNTSVRYTSNIECCIFYPCKGE